MKYLRIILVTVLFAALLGTASAEVTFEGASFDPEAVYIDLGDRVVSDFDAFISFLDQMPNLRQVDMWNTTMTAGMCDLLAARFPDMKWGWTMKLQGRDHFHLIRTDYTSWSTLHNNSTTHHTSEDFHILKYCWDLKALDVGHNSVTDLNFLYDLPDLRVLIVACNEVTDITPVASLRKLEYVELFKNKITDISPLAGLTHLLDVNICFNQVMDWSPLKTLTNCMRLWIYSSQKFNQRPPANVVADLKQALPNTLIDDSHYSTAGAWRMLNENTRHPHYECIVQMFGDSHLHPKYDYVPFPESSMFDGEP
jgi:hypothetical protein